MSKADPSPKKPSKKLKTSFKVRLLVFLVLLVTSAVSTLSFYFVHFQRQQKLAATFESEYFSVNQLASSIENLAVSNSNKRGILFNQADPCNFKETDSPDFVDPLLRSSKVDPSLWTLSQRVAALCQAKDVLFGASNSGSGGGIPILWQPGLDGAKDGPPAPVPSLLVFTPKALSLISLEAYLSAEPGHALFLTNDKGNILWSEHPMGDLQTALKRDEVSEANLKDLSQNAIKAKLSSIFKVDSGALLAFAPVLGGYTAFGYVNPKTLSRGIDTIVTQSLWLTLGLLSLALFFGLLFAARISVPLSDLATKADEFGQGQLGARVQTTETDEIGVIQYSFNQMAERITDLIHKTKKQAQLENDLKLAEKVQQLLLPKNTLTFQPHFITSYVKMADQCGGDWWGALPLPNKRLLLFAGDVTGHGISSALVTASTKGTLSALSWLVDANPAYAEADPKALLSVFNRSVYEAAEGALGMTFLAILFDTEQKKVFISNAGNPKPYLLSFKDKKVSNITSPGPSLGANRDENGFIIDEFEWNPGDQIFLYSDGFIDASMTPGSKNLFERKHLTRAIKDFVKQSPSNQTLIPYLLKVRKEMAPNVPQVDDISLVHCTWTMEGPSA